MRYQASEATDNDNQLPFGYVQIRLVASKAELEAAVAELNQTVGAGNIE